MRGRRPKPTALRKLLGNPGKRPFNEREPQPMPGEPEMPKLSREAVAEWRRIVPLLLRIGVLTIVDGKALAGYCHAYARWVQAERDVRRYGVTIREPVLHNGEVLKGIFRVKRNPAVSVPSDSLKPMKSFLVEFGLTPASRPRLASLCLPMERPEADDAAEQFFNDPPIQ